MMETQGYHKSSIERIVSTPSWRASPSGTTEKEIRKIAFAIGLKNFAPHTITKVDSLLHEIEQIRKRSRP